MARGWLVHLRRNLLLIAFALLATNAYSASKTVLVLGDSLSAEYGLARGAGWVALLERRLKVQNIDAVVVNASISGETTSGGKARLPALLDKFHPALVVIELGGNDGLRGLPLSASEANLRAMISAAQHAKAKILLVGMQIPPNYGRDYTQKFAALYGKLARDAKAPLVPFLLKDVADQPQLFQADRIHPTAAAHPIMLDNVWPQLQPLLK
ncbi:arylesterase [Undibacterium arcticum]|uniref:Arylesterase n=1 Tax=Undibacterium arcticum TaxID=1762892 RepID=A0ABV7EUR5_9BURK